MSQIALWSLLISSKRLQVVARILVAAETRGLSSSFALVVASEWTTVESTGKD